MAVLPIKTMFGRWVGLTRESSNLTGKMLFSKRGFYGPYLYLQSTEPTEASTSDIVDLEGYTTVTSITTSSTSVTARGIGSVSSSSGQWTLAAPIPGVRKVLFATSTSTLLRSFAVSTASNIELGILNTTNHGTTAGSSYRAIHLKAQGETVTLVGLSTTVYAVLAVNGVATGSTMFSTSL
jgi:hypothetical protein